MRRILTRLVLVLGLLGTMLGGAATAATAKAQGPVTHIVNIKTGGSLLPHNWGEGFQDGWVHYAYDRGATLGADLWEFEYLGGFTHIIRNTKTGMCLKPGAPVGNKPRVTEGTCGTGLQFQWDLIQRFSGEYKIYSRSAHQVMTPYYGYGLNEIVVLEPDSNVEKVWWSIDNL
ncbi:RICIN domain-containing protein [Streptomyces sp. TRM68367]|uniref:RICIN domain-containing protein n=1 Tax=Streptomyces sp. TRM68367 TaxID=2758415 RepID=UPI00165B28E0|nr:RICIN domain-containing protein [Streptomyces sp. TRM68367]MBC9728138.1 RICIN domain-containing protein [Streptomyces sp. TRM68367]